MEPALLKNFNTRNIILGLLVLSVVGSIGSYVWRGFSSKEGSKCTTHHDTYQVISSKFQVPSPELLVADSPAKWEYGLMNVRSKKDICGHDGMIFTFPIAMPQTFWNKNTLVDLDIYWMKGKKIVGQSQLPAITKSGLTTISSPMAVDKVVEIIR